MRYLRNARHLPTLTTATAWIRIPRLQRAGMAGLEIAGMALAGADAVVNVLGAIKGRCHAHKKIPSLIDSTERRVLRIRKTISTYGALGERTSVPGDVFERVVEDFDSITTELADIQAKISSGSKFNNWLFSPAFVDSLSTAVSRLGPLEMHLDMYGLMSYRENTIASGFADLASSIRRLSDGVGVGLQHDLNAMMSKIDAIFERLALGTPENINSGRSATSADTLLDAVDEVEALSLKEFSSLSSKAGELLEMLVSSGISCEDKRELGDKIHRIWSGWQVDIEDIEFDMTKGGFRKCLGEGGFSSVYKGRLVRKEGEPLLIAFKHLKIERHELPGRRADFLRELFLQMDIDHPCVLKTYGGFWPEVESADYFTGATNDFEDDDDDEYIPPYIVTERMTCNVAKAIRGNLLQDATSQKRIALDVAEGLVHLHGRRVVHRDIKPENILLRLKNGEMIGNAKISDFGISRRVRLAQQDITYSTSGGPSGTIGYMPPEVLCDIRSYPSRKSWDVWSFGVLVCYITVLECRAELSSLQPFKAETIARSGEFAEMMRNLASKVIDPVLREVAKMCLVAQAEDRPEMQRVARILQGRDAVNVEIPKSDCNQNEKHSFNPVHLNDEELMEIAREQKLSAARPNDGAQLEGEIDGERSLEEEEQPKMQRFARILQRSDSINVDIPDSDGKRKEEHSFNAVHLNDEELMEIAREQRLSAVRPNDEAQLEDDTDGEKSLEEEEQPEMQRFARILQRSDSINVNIPDSDGKRQEEHSFNAVHLNDEELLEIEREQRLSAARLNDEPQLKDEREDLDFVEQAMERHPAVSQAKAFSRRKQWGRGEVSCAIVPKKGSRVTEPWLRLFAQSQLPRYMIPKKFYYLKELPQNMTRRELSESALLRDLSEFSGYLELGTKKWKVSNWRRK